MSTLPDEDEVVLDRLFTSAGIPRDAPGRLEATIRHGDPLAKAGARPTVVGDAEAGRRTASFLPSITLSDASLEAGPPSDLHISTLLGQGGMGVVHLASQSSLGRAVAIKRPLAVSGEALVEEARTMARVEHPNVVPVHALGRDANERPVLVMKRIEGASFRDLLRDESHAAWPPLISRWGDRERASLGILGEVADALSLAHARGIVHRDVKPENVMIGEFGEVYLLDWGIARRADMSPNTIGKVVGTPGYMAPEMIVTPDDVDARTDVYLLGATLHEILTKTMRHVGDSLYMTLSKALLSEPVEYGPDVPEDLARLANAATSADKDARPASAAEFRRALRDHERHREASGLVRDARETLEPLVRGSLSLTDAGALVRLNESGALLAAARRIVPESTPVAAAQDEHAVLSIERDLAVESPVSARAHLAQLRAPRPDLERRVAELEAALSQAKSSEAAMAAERAEAETISGLRPRVTMLVAIYGCVALATVVLTTTGHEEDAGLSARRIVGNDLAILSFMTLGAIVARKRLFGNRANRSLSWAALACFAGVAASNGLGIALGRPLNQVLAQTYVLITTMLAASAAFVHPVYLVGAVTSATSCVLLVVMPEHARLIADAGMFCAAGAIIAGAYANAKRSVARRGESVPPPSR